MTSGDSRRRRLARRSAAAGWAVACLALASQAAATAGARSEGDLSPRLAELAKPELRSAPQAEQAAALSLAPDGPGSLLRRGNRVLVEVRFERGAAAGAGDLRAVGARVVNVSRRYQTVTVAARPADLPQVAAVPRVAGVTEVLAPIVSATGCAGAATSEGDSQLGAASVRSALNLDGAGVKVGILSDSFGTDKEAVTSPLADVLSGDLPGSGNPCGRTTAVGVLQDFAEPEEAADEGRAMAQIVHDLAPGASLAFATAFTGLTAFANNVRSLHAAGARVIADDVVYFEEPFFQEGPIAVAVNEVTAGGAAYFSSAGNNNLISSGNDIASWEAKAFRDAIACPVELKAATGAEHCMDFDPGPGLTEDDPTFGITVSKGATLTVDLQWAEPWNGVTADLDLYLLDDEDKPVEVESTNDNVGQTQRPVEFFQWENDTGKVAEVRLAIDRCFGPICNEGASGLAKPRLKLALLQNGGGVTATEYPESEGGDVVGPTIFGHNGAASAVSVGAVPFNNSSIVEPYSSRGPVNHYFGPVVGTSPAQPIPPQTIAKPDLAATDCGVTTFFTPTKTPGLFRFCGTSASAPHAAAVAALMGEANPSLSPAQIRAALAATAQPVGAFGPNAAGAGLVNAYGAVTSVALPPRISITEPPAALSKNSSPRIGFAANRPVTFSCSIDAGPLESCTSPFVPATPLADGEHGFAVAGTDLAGRTGASETAHFKVDTRRPRTFFRKRPRKRIRTRHRKAKARFRFGSNERDVVFVCRVDGGLPRFCPERFRRRFPVGKHTMRVKARDAVGNVDRTPAVYRFQVKRVG